MKKVFVFLAAIAVFGFAISCNKDNGNNEGNTATKKETVTLNIAMDGAFDDWKGLQGASVAEVPVDETATPYLLKMVAVADSQNIYFYFQYQVEEEQTAAPFNLDIDADDDPSTGVTLGEYWKDAGIDYEISSSGGFINGANYRKMSDVKLYVAKEDFWGQDRWVTGAVTDKTAKGVKSAGVRNGDLVEIEMLVPRTLIKAEKKGSARVGCLVSNAEWAVMGFLPCDDGRAATEMMEVTLP